MTAPPRRSAIVRWLPLAVVATVNGILAGVVIYPDLGVVPWVVFTATWSPVTGALAGMWAVR